MEEIRPNCFRIKIPLPKSPLKYLNSYCIRSSDRNLIIDTGLNHKECLEAMQSGLEELNIELAKTDFFITHLHADHLGLVGKLVTDTSKIFLNRPETELIESWVGWEPMVACAGKMVFRKMSFVRPLNPTRDTNLLRTGYQNLAFYAMEMKLTSESTYLGAFPHLVTVWAICAYMNQDKKFLLPATIF